MPEMKGVYLVKSGVDGEPESHIDAYERKPPLESS
jgi:hypothetical protein